MASRKYGVVYTPYRLAEFVATLLIDEMSADGYSANSFLDPACGECALLEAVYNKCGKSVNYYGIDVDKEVDANNSVCTQFFRNDSILPVNVKKTTDSFWKSKFKRIDAIIANPPWSSEKIYDKELLKRAGFTLVDGQYDSYVLFAELSYSIVSDNGYFAFILPDSLFDAQNTPLRKMLTENTEIKVIARLGEKIFDEVNRATTVIICRKKRPTRHSYTKCFRLNTEDRRLFLAENANLMDLFLKKNHSVKQSRFKNNDSYLFDIDATENDEITLDKIKDTGTNLSELFVFSRGVEISKTGNTVECPYCKFHQGYKKSHLQHKKKVCAFCGKEILVDITTVSCVIFKKKIKGTAPIVVGENLHRYIVDTPLYIKQNVNGINYKNPEIYQSPKLLIRKTGLGIYASVDYSNSLTSQTVYMLSPVCTNQVEIEYYLALLNSRVVYYYYLKRYGENEWKSHPYLTKEIIFSLPIAKYDDSVIDKKIIDISKQLLADYSYELDMELENLIFKKYKLDSNDINNIKDEINRLPDLGAINGMKFEV